MKRFLVGCVLWLALCAQAIAQVPYFPQTLPAGTVVGRMPGTAGATEAIPFSVFISQLGGAAFPSCTSGTPIVSNGTTNTAQCYSSPLLLGTNAAINAPVTASFTNAAGATYFQAAQTTPTGIVNYLQVVGNTSTNAPYIAAQGSDANINLNLVTKGTGIVTVNGAPLTVPNVRLQLSGSVIYYFAASACSDSNSGLSPAAALCTLQTAYNKHYQTVDLNGYSITYQLAAGTYTQGLTINSSFVGQLSAGQFFVQGVANNHAAVVLQPTAGNYSIGMSYGAQATIQWLKLDHTNSPQDQIAVAQFSSLRIANVEFGHNVNPYNNMSVFLNSLVVFQGDMYTSSNSQAVLYISDSSSAYPNINNAKSQNITGNTTNTSATITTLSTTTGLLAGQTVRGTGIPEGATIVSINTGASTMVISAPATATGTTVALRTGGILWTFSGGATSLVSTIFATEGASVNLQALEWIGTNTGQAFVVKNGAGFDTGATNLSSVAGTIPGFIDSAAGGWARDDNTGSILYLPKVAAGQISGTVSNGQIYFRNFNAGAFTANANGVIQTDGTGVVSFQNTSGGYFQVATASATPVNYIQVVGNATGNAPYFAAQGTDANVGLTLLTKGTGILTLQSNGATVLQLDNNTHLRPGGTAPALTSCGTSPTIVGTDTAGIVTMGTTATGCIITFNKAYSAAPYCVVTWIATPLVSQSYVTAAATITTTQTSASNNKLQYVCLAQAGG